MPDNKDIILKNLISSFYEYYYKKYLSKKDPNYVEIKEIYQKCIDPKEKWKGKYLTKIFQILENSDVKLTDKIVSLFEEIEKKKLIENNDLLNDCELRFIIAIYKSKAIRNDNVNQKILSLCASLFIENNFEMIHGEYLKYIVEISLKCIFSCKSTQASKASKASLTQIFNCLIKKVLQEKNNDYISEANSRKIVSYLTTYLVDTVQIEAQLTNEDKKFTTVLNDKTEIEKFNLTSEKNCTIINESKFSLGKYGWCAVCRKPAEFFIDDPSVKLPVCSKESTCETMIMLHSLTRKQVNFYDVATILTLLSRVSTTSTKEDSSFQAREFALSQIEFILDPTAKFLTSTHSIIQIIKEKLIDSLVYNTFANEELFKTSVKLFLLILRNFREHLKDQIEIIFNRVMMSILESENYSFLYKDIILDVLLNLASDNFFIGVYINYDCDINYKQLFGEVLNLITKITNGYYKKPKYSLVVKSNEEIKLQKKALRFFVKLATNISNAVSDSKDDSEQMITHPPLRNDIRYNSKITEVSVDDSDTKYSDSIEEKKDQISQNLKLKMTLAKAVDKFNIGGGNCCLKFLIAEKLIISEEEYNYIKENQHELTEEEKEFLSKTEQEIFQVCFTSSNNYGLYYISKYSNKLSASIKLSYEDFTAFELARFIRSNIKGLSRDSVGSFLCSSKKFNLKVLTHFMNSFNFKGIHILDALRLLFTELPLIGEGQIIDRIVQLFGSRYHKENPTILKNPDVCYYLSFSIIMLNTDLHREEVLKKMTSEEYVQRVLSMCPSDVIDKDYLIDIYDKIKNNPLVIPGQKLVLTSKRKEDLIKKEKEENLRKTFQLLQSKTIVKSNLYITSVDTDNIKHLLENYWSNFLGIFSSQILFKEEGFDEFIKLILLLAKTCGLLHLDTIAEAFINTIINETNLLTGKEITEKNFECIKQIAYFLINNGQYIKASWNSLINFISMVDFYQNTPTEEFTEEIENKVKSQSDKESTIQIELKNRQTLMKLNNAVCASIFSKTVNYDEETIMNFIQNLCIVSKAELNDYFNSRTFSLHKLIEVAEFNLSRIQVEWVNIWKVISQHLVYVILNSLKENIWREALESLRQIISKLLQKDDLMIYNFQKDFFKPFEIIFEQSLEKKYMVRCEIIFTYISRFIEAYGKIIHSGWVVIFNIFKCGLIEKTEGMVNDIKDILLKLKESNTMIREKTLLRGFIECLCLLYLKNEDDKLIVLGIIYEIINKISSKDGKELIEVIKRIFFYLDYLSFQAIESYFSLIADILEHYKKEIFEDYKPFLYLYLSYFKPHFCSLSLAKFSYNLDNYSEEVDDQEYSNFKKTNSNESIGNNIYAHLFFSLERLKKDASGLIQKKEGANNEEELVEYLCTFSSLYEKDIDLYSASHGYFKTQEVGKISSSMDLFLECLTERAFLKEEKIPNKFILSMNFLYIDLLISIQRLSIFSSISGILMEKLEKNLQADVILNASEKQIEAIRASNNSIIRIISKSKLKPNSIFDEQVYLQFNGDYLHFFDSLLEPRVYSKFVSESNAEEINNKISFMLDVYLADSDFHRILRSKIIIKTISYLQKIQNKILSNNIQNVDIYNTYKTFEKYFSIIEKYKIINDTKRDYSEFLNLVNFYLTNIAEKCIKFLPKKHLTTLFSNSMTLNESALLRESVKDILQKFLLYNLFEFNSDIIPN